MIKKNQMLGQDETMFESFRSLAFHLVFLDDRLADVTEPKIVDIRHLVFDF